MIRLALVVTATLLFVQGAVAVTASSPTGRLAFTSFRDGPVHLYAMNGDGTGERPLKTGGEGVQEPAWSPDGKSLAFVRYDQANGVQGIAVGMPGMRSFRWLTRVALGKQASLDNSPDWSADGRSILFARTNFEANRSDIFLVPARGGRARRITTGWYPDFSPDGRRIVLCLRGADGSLDLFVARADGRGKRRIVANPGDDLLPDWSPNGKRIAFVANRDGNSEIYVVNASGTGLRRLTFVDGLDLGPAFSPNGRRIAFASNRAGTGLDIYGMNADGKRQKRLTNTPRDDNDPAWLPPARARGSR